MTVRSAARCSAVLIAFLALAPFGRAQAALTLEQALNLRRISDLQFSPDGARVAFTVAEPPKDDKNVQHIWVLDVKSRALRQFTNSTESESSPRWSPDGRTLAFISKRDEFRQIYVMAADFGEATRLTEGKSNVQALAWSPDGKQIAYLAPESKTDAEEKKTKDKDDARVVDKDDKHARLWAIEVATKKVRQLTSDNWRASSLEWTPDGTRVIVVATDHPESDRHTNRIYAVSAADGKMQEIAAPRGPFGDLRISPDGRWIAYLAARVDGPSPHDLYLQPVAGGPGRNLTGAALDRPVGDYRWTGDGGLLAVIEDGFRSRFVSLTLAGSAKPLAGFSVNPSALACTVSGEVAFVGRTATDPAELWLWDGHGQPTRVSNFNASWEKFALAQLATFTYRSFDGQPIEAGLMKPVNHDGKSRLPLIVLIHGGPTGAWSDSLDPLGQLLVAKGFAVFYPNIRGSTGYGHKFVEMNRADWGGGDFKDVMAGVDYLIAQGVADPDRLGIGGWSYGGYMAEWAITQTNRFKAAVSGAGMSNLIAEFGTEQGPAYDEWFFGLPYENLEGFLKSSPIKYVKNARTPCLILQGENDTTDPIGQSQELYRALKYYEVPAELIIYPREGHGLREEKHQLDRLTRTVAWFEKYLKPGPPPAGSR